MAGGKNRSNNSLSQYKSITVNGAKIYLMPVNGARGLYTLKTADGRFAGSEKIFSARSYGDAVKEMKRTGKAIEAELSAMNTQEDDKVTVEAYNAAEPATSEEESSEKGIGFFRKTAIASKNVSARVSSATGLTADSISDAALNAAKDKGLSLMNSALSEISSASKRDLMSTPIVADTVKNLTRKASQWAAFSDRRDKKDFESGLLEDRRSYLAKGHAANAAALNEYKAPLYAKLDKIKADLEIERREALNNGDTDALSEINARQRKLTDQRKALDTHVPKDFVAPYPKLPKRQINHGQKGMRLRDRWKLESAELDMKNRDAYSEAEAKLARKRSAKAAKNSEEISENLG